MSPSRSETVLAVVGAPDDPRVTDFQAALQRCGRERAVVVPYDGLSRAALGRATHVRMESPGRSPEILRTVLGMGAARCGAEGGAPLEGREIDDAIADRGRIAGVRQFFLGLVEAMNRVSRFSAPARFMNHPDDIALAFDKPRCQAELARRGVPVPALLGPLGSYAELREAMATGRAPRVFIKLRHGSAASGIVAYETMGDREHAWTTAEVADGAASTRLYNTRRVRRYRERGRIRQLVDALAQQGAYVERWVPKASLGDHSADFRVVTVAGEPTHWVLRTARSPFTNLHLGGNRESPELLRTRMTDEAWQALVDSCRRTAEAFPASLYLGLDVAVSHDLCRHYVLEVNAFGDYVKNVFAPGHTPHDAEIAALWRRTSGSRGRSTDHGEAPRC